MERSKLLGRLILIVEDEPLIAYDTAQAFEQAGAVVKTAHSLNEALRSRSHRGAVGCRY